MGYDFKKQYTVGTISFTDKLLDVRIYYNNAVGAADDVYNYIDNFLQDLVNKGGIDGAWVRLYSSDFNASGYSSCADLLSAWKSATSDRTTVNAAHLFVNSVGMSCGMGNAWIDDAPCTVRDDHRFDNYRMASVAMQEVLHTYIDGGLSGVNSMFSDGSTSQGDEHDLGKSFSNGVNNVATPMALTHQDSQIVGDCKGLFRTNYVAHKVTQCTSDAVEITYNTWG